MQSYIRCYTCILGVCMCVCGGYMTLTDLAHWIIEKFDLFCLNLFDLRCEGESKWVQTGETLGEAVTARRAGTVGSNEASRASFIDLLRSQQALLGRLWLGVGHALARRRGRRPHWSFSYALLGVLLLLRASFVHEMLHSRRDALGHHSGRRPVLAKEASFTDRNSGRGVGLVGQSGVVWWGVGWRGAHAESREHGTRKLPMAPFCIAPRSA